MKRAGARLAVATLALGVASCGRAPGPRASTSTSPPPPPPTRAAAMLSLRDDAPDFLAFWKRARAEDDAARVARYKTEIVPAFPLYWSYVAQGEEGGMDAYVATRLAAFDAIAPRFAAAAARLPANLTTAIATMRRAFPDFDPQVEVRLFHSLGRMDGGTRVFEGRYFLLFGVDMIAELHTWSDDRPFFVHELFHTYADQKRGRDGRNPHPIESIEEERTERVVPLYSAIWEEGLATYVSEWLNPGVSHDTLLLDIPAKMEATCLANLSFLANDVIPKLESKSVADYGDYLGFRSKDPRRPKRAGYCIGYLAAKELHRTLPMSALVDLAGEPLRARLASVLATLAAPPAVGPASRQ